MADDLAWRAKRHGLHYVEADKLCFKREKGPRGVRYLGLSRAETALMRFLENTFNGNQERQAKTLPHP